MTNTGRELLQPLVAKAVELALKEREANLQEIVSQVAAEAGVDPKLAVKVVKETLRMVKRLMGRRRGRYINLTINYQVK